VRFWDASAVVPLITEEDFSARVRSVLEEDDLMIVWWGTEIECVSALSRKRHHGVLAEDQFEQSIDLLIYLLERWAEIQPVHDLRVEAEYLLASYALRAADALQLAAALKWCKYEPAGIGFVCLDDKLREAAERQGFKVLPA
jgi:predicted nucleic acid-binding protein